mgnify:CR=1 FL=1
MQNNFFDNYLYMCGCSFFNSDQGQEWVIFIFLVSWFSSEGALTFTSVARSLAAREAVKTYVNLIF